MSNSSFDPDVPAAGPEAVVVRKVRPAEIDSCVPFLISTDNRPAADALVQQFRHYAALRSLRLDRMFVAQAGDRIVWYLLPIPSPGRTTMFLLPGASPGALAPRADDLVLEAACAEARAEGIHLAQVLIDPADSSNRALAGRHGFIHLAELIYLQMIPPLRAAMPPMPDGFSLRKYSAAAHGLFAEAILQSYRESLDCPGLAGRRDIEDIIVGHKAAGDFDPETWFALCEDGRPAGVLLLSTVTGHETTELVYIGLSPSARGRGLGRFLLQVALHTTLATHNRRLTLAVDSKNTPALKLYYTSGFQRMAAKSALLNDLRD